MSFFVAHNGTNISDKVRWNSLSFESARRGDALLFSVPYNLYSMSVGDEVSLLEGNDFSTAQPIFAGTIIETSLEARGIEQLQTVRVRDWTHKLDGKLVVREYEETTVEDIIANILSLYAPDFSAAGVSCPVVVHRVRFDYKRITQCISLLADITGYYWWVSPDKTIYFQQTPPPAPSAITEQTMSAVWQSVKVGDTIDQIRNVVILRGRDIVSTSTITEDLSPQANGSNKVFKLGYRYKNYSLTINGVDKTVGIENIDDPSLFDALYNFSEKTLTFQTPPASSDTIIFSGNIFIPLRVVWKDYSSISKYGEREFIIYAGDIGDIDSAKARAKQEILRYRNALSDGSFVSYIGGWRAGQLVEISLPSRGISGSFIVQRVRAKSRSPQRLSYQVSIASASTLDTLDILRRAIQKGVEVETHENETLIQVDGFVENVVLNEFWNTGLSSDEYDYSEILTLSEAWRVNPFTDIVWVAGPYIPTSTTDNNRVPITDSSGVAM